MNYNPVRCKYQEPPTLMNFDRSSPIPRISFSPTIIIAPIPASLGLEFLGPSGSANEHSPGTTLNNCFIRIHNLFAHPTNCFTLSVFVTIATEQREN